MTDKLAIACLAKQVGKGWWGRRLGIAACFVVLMAAGCSGGEEKSSAGKTAQHPGAAAPPAAMAPVVGESPQIPTTGSSPGGPPTAATAPADQERQPAQEQPASLGLTINEFCRRFNQNSETVKSKLRIKKLQLVAGAGQNTFRHAFNENLYLAGKVSKSDGAVVEMTLNGVLNGSLATTVDLNLGIGTIITALNPELSRERRDSILNALGINNDRADIYNLDKRVTRNGISYWLKSSRQAGLRFGVKSAEGH